MHLAFNVMTNSELFVDGMHLVRGAELDLTSIKSIALRSKSSVDFLQAQIVLQASKALYLERKKRRLMLVRDLTVRVVSGLLKREQEIVKVAANHEYRRALELALEMISEIETMADMKIQAIEIIKNRV